MPGKKNSRSIRRPHAGRSSTTTPLLRSMLRKMDDQDLKRPPRVPDVQPLSLNPKRRFIFRDSFVYGTISGAVGGTFGVVQFSLASLANLTSYQTLFDQYRILQAEVQFLPRQIQGAGANVPVFVTCFDYDDATSPTSVGQLLNYDSAQVSPANIIQARVFSPTPLGQLFATITGYSNVNPRQWIDTDYSTVPFYGLKYALDVAPNTNAFYEIVASLTIQFRYNKG
jgi:hypothetical protein